MAPAGWRGLDTLPSAVLFAGICRVHRADLLRVKGDWAKAEEEVFRVCRDLVDTSRRCTA